MKKSAKKKTDEAAPIEFYDSMIVTDGLFEAQADFSEFAHPGFLGIMNEDGFILNASDPEFDDLVLDEMCYF